jgi:hypothetical protein
VHTQHKNIFGSFYTFLPRKVKIWSIFIYYKETKHQLCWTLVSVLPTSFVKWVKPLSWNLTLEIVVEINVGRFCSNNNHSPTNGITTTDLEFEIFLARGGEILLDIGFNASCGFHDMG